jgi:hypothetical protein
MVASCLPGSELPGKIVEGVEGMAAVETLLIFSVTAFYLAVVPGRVRTNLL